MMRELTLEKTNKIIKDSGWNHDLFQKEIMRMPTLSGFIIAYLAISVGSLSGAILESGRKLISSP